VGHIAQVKGTQQMSEIRGLTVSHPALGWALTFGVVAIVGLPPMGIFMTEFLIVTSTFARAPALAVALGLGILVALGALLLRLNGLAFGEPYGSGRPARASFVPVFAHFGLVLVAGIWLPPALVAWFQHVAALLN
jgi:hydrogenase-4 component F